MKLKASLIVVLFCFACKNSSLKFKEPSLYNSQILKLPINDSDSITYYIKDTLSTLYISHQECTECLDAYVDSGIVFIPEVVAEKILKIHNYKSLNFISHHDLKLIGKTKMNEELFGTQDNFMSKWHDRFLTKGKVIDIADGGLLFYVESYEKVYDE